MPASASLARNGSVDDWIALEGDGEVLVRTGKVDFGQRISHAIARVAAEELGVNPARVRVPGVDTTEAPDEGYTSGSNSMEQSGHAVVAAAATARARLLELGAEHLAVERAELVLEDGVMFSRATNRSVSYWELMSGRRFDLAVDPEAVVKPPDTYTQLGREGSGEDVTGLVTGATRFIHDLQPPGLQHARVVRPPHYHARLMALDPGVEASLVDVKLVRNASFLAVVGPHEHGVVKAAARVARAARWEPERGFEDVPWQTLLEKNERVSLPVFDCVPRDAPLEPLPAAPAGTAHEHRARYLRPYQMHATIGPSAALAHLEGEHLTVWTNTQGVYPLRDAIAAALERAPESVTLVYGRGSGVYGHNGADDAAMDAALVALECPGEPVLLKWTREDEHAWEPYGPCMAMELAARVSEGGHISGWSHETYSDTHVVRSPPAPARPDPSVLIAPRLSEAALEPREPQPTMNVNGGIHRNATPIYDFGETRVVKHLVRGLPLRVSALRTLGAYANTWAAESFLDEMAALAETDPLEFRLRHLEEPRARAVLEAAAEAYGWQRRERPDGASVGHGLAVARYKNMKAYSAVCVEVAVADDGRVSLRRACISVDAGQVADPDGLRSQLEGGFIHAASWTLHEAVGYDSGGVTTRDWETYPILRFDNVPEIECVLVNRPGEPFLGAGEASCGPTGAAIGNAIFDAIGLRMRELPYTPDAVRRAAGA